MVNSDISGFNFNNTKIFNNVNLSEMCQWDHGWADSLHWRNVLSVEKCKPSRFKSFIQDLKESLWEISFKYAYKIFSALIPIYYFWVEYGQPSKAQMQGNCSDTILKSQ